MKKRKMILVPLLCIFGICNIQSIRFSQADYSDVDDTKIEEVISQRDSTDDSDDASGENGQKIDKKMIKKELQNRRKFHKNLLHTYNQSFEKHVFEMISQNAQYISRLETLV